MKFLFDLFPVLLFFGVYRYGDKHPEWADGIASSWLSPLISGGVVPAGQAPILVATLIAIIATAAQVTYLLVRGRKVDVMLWLSLAIIVVAGGATIYFHDEAFIKWKPTILYWAFAVVLLGSQLLYRKNLMRKLMEANISLPDHVWSRVGFAWSGFFVFMGLLNLLVAFVIFRNDTSAWVSFKLFGMTGLFLVYVVAQGVWLSKYMEEEKA